MPIPNPTELEKVELDVVRALVAGLPEPWTEAVLEVQRILKPGGNVEHSLLIRPPPGQTGIVIPGDELLLAVRQLDLLFSERKHPFATLRVSVHQSEDGAWDFATSHTYEDA